MTDAESSTLESHGDEEDGTVHHEGSGRLLYAVSFGFGTIALGLLVMAPLLPTIISDLAITPFQAGLGLSVMWGLNAVSQYPGGRISDEIGRKTVLVFALVGFVAGFVVVTATATFVGFLVGVAVLGLCSGLYPPTGYTLLSERYAQTRGKAFGIYTGHWDVGGGVSAGLAAAALAFGEWRLAFPPIIVLALIVIALIHSWSREPYAVSRVSFDFRGTIRRTLIDREVTLLTLAFCLFMLTWQGAISFLPTFLQLEKGLSPGIAATAFASLFAIGMVAKPLSGNLGDRFGQLRLTLCSLSLGVGGLVVLSIATTTPWLLAGVALFATGLMSFTPPTLAYVMATLPDGNTGGDLGGLRTIYMGVGSFGSTYVGFVAGMTTYGIAFAGLVVSLLASAVLVVSARRI